VSGPEPASGSADYTCLDVNIRAGADVWVRCHAYPHRAPILAVLSKPASLSVTVPPGPVDAAGLAFARDFAAAAAAFLAECERHAAEKPGSAPETA
jgi:hypothetical protein